MTPGNSAPASGERDHPGDRAGQGQRAGEGAPQASGDSTPTDSLTYEQARDQLTDVVRKLEGGGLTLEQALELWELGEKLATVCSERLEGARARLAASMPDSSGSTGTDVPF